MKKDWVPTQDAFQRLLHWLDAGVDSGGDRYLEMRRRLVVYFDRKNCLSSDELADETLNRVARKLEEKGSIDELSPAHYCYVVAKFVFLEYLRGNEYGQTTFDEPTHSSLRQVSGGPSQDAMEADPGEKLHECLEHCLGQLPARDRALILEYYQGEGRTKIERRSQLAGRLGLSMNALSIRACRIRDKLEVCVKECRGG